MSFAAALAKARRNSTDPDLLSDLAAEALRAGEEEAAIPLVLHAAETSNCALLWQWAGLLQRSLDEHEAALISFAEATRLSPADARIAHGHARTTMEAGLDAVALYELALSLEPQDGGILIGLAAAMTAAGQGMAAADRLQRALDRAPLWIAGHEQLAQLLSTLGRRCDATRSLEHALASHPGELRLWTALLGLELRRENYSGLRTWLDRARSAGLPGHALAVFEAICAGELDDGARPAPLFGVGSLEAQSALAVWRIRHLLRIGDVEAASSIIDDELRSEGNPDVWPYAALAWRLGSDPRHEWLEQDGGTIREFDLRDDLPSIDLLATNLHALHVAKAEYLDQSVRGGTQTDGPLLSRIDPVIRQLRTAIVGAVGKYVAGLPAADPRHPLLHHRRDRRVRFAGSWSVRLSSGGHHASHVHPQGWISSALYVRLPERTAEEPQDSGCLTLGAPPEDLRLPLEARRQIEPKPGHLVLFPSWMWHGTQPFAEGERLTVAFDVRPPI